MKLRFAGYQSENSVHTRAGRLFAERLPALCPEVETVEVRASVTDIGKGAWDLPSMVEGQEIDFCYFSTAGISDRVPALGVIDLPYTVSDRHRAFACLDGPLGRRLIADIESATPFKILGLWDNGIRHITNSERPLHGPEDCRGLRIRTLNNQLYRDIMAAVGFESMSTDPKDLKRVCASGEVHAQENPLTNLLHFGLWEYHRHVTMTAHVFGVGLFLCNRAAFDSWPATVQEAAFAAAGEASKANRAFAAQEDIDCRRELEAKGVAFVDLTADERAAFRDAAEPVVKPYRDKIDPGLVEEYIAAQA